MAGTVAFFNPFTGFQFLAPDPMAQEAERGLKRSQMRSNESINYEHSRRAREQNKVESERIKAMERVGMEQAKAAKSGANSSAMINALYKQNQDAQSRMDAAAYVDQVNRSIESLEAAIRNGSGGLTDGVIGTLPEKWANVVRGWLGRKDADGKPLPVSRKEFEDARRKFLDDAYGRLPKEYQQWVTPDFSKGRMSVIWGGSPSSQRQAQPGDSGSSGNTAKQPLLPPSDDIDTDPARPENMSDGVAKTRNATATTKSGGTGSPAGYGNITFYANGVPVIAGPGGKIDLSKIPGGGPESVHLPYYPGVYDGSDQSPPVENLPYFPMTNEAMDLELLRPLQMVGGQLIQ